MKEAHFGQHPYDLVYAYDIAGNRTQKVDLLNDIEVYYFYDVAEPETYGSQFRRMGRLAHLLILPCARRASSSTRWAG